MKNHKKVMRKMVLELRNLLGAEEIIEKSKMIMERLFELKDFKTSNIIMSYVNFKSEVVTEYFIKECLAQGKRIVVPAIVVNPNGKSELIASEISSFENDLTPGKFGILSPKESNIRKIEPSEIDLAVIPGVAFDIRRNRIGYGAGYYDRFLKKLSVSCMKIGVAYEIQIADELPIDRYDVPLNMIITENAII